MARTVRIKLFWDAFTAENLPRVRAVRLAWSVGGGAEQTKEGAITMADQFTSHEIEVTENASVAASLVALGNNGGVSKPATLEFQLTSAKVDDWLNGTPMPMGFGWAIVGVTEV